MNDEGGPVVGTDAVHSGRRKPERYEPNPKRRIDDGRILLGDRELPATSVIAAVLSRVARECGQTLGGGLGPVTVTVPAAWGPTRRHVIADAAGAAGLGKVDLVPEPVAAASYFVGALDNEVPVGSGVVVYHLGGGTLDATVLRSTPSGFEVLAVDGADDLGSAVFGDPVSEVVQAHQVAVTRMYIAQLDGADVAVTGGEDGLIRVWDLTTGEDLHVYRGHEYEISALLITEYQGSPVVCSSDGESEAVWNLDDPDNPLDERDAVYGDVNWVGLLPDGTPAYLASGDVHQLFTGDELGGVYSPGADAWTLMEVDGELRAVGLDDNRVIVTDLEDGENVSGTFDQVPNEVVTLNIGEVDGTALAVTATNTGSIQAWDLTSAERYGTEASDSFQSIKGLEILTVDDGAAILVWGTKGVNLFDLETGDQIENTFAPPVGEEGFLARAAQINDHRVTVTASSTGELQVWSINV